MYFRSLHCRCYNLSVPVCTKNIGDVFFTSAQRDHCHHSENRTWRCRNLHMWKQRPPCPALQDKFHYCWSHRYVYGPSALPSDRLNLCRIRAQHCRRHRQQLFLSLLCRPIIMSHDCATNSLFSCLYGVFRSSHWLICHETVCASAEHCFIIGLGYQ